MENKMKVFAMFGQVVLTIALQIGLVFWGKAHSESYIGVTATIIALMFFAAIFHHTIGKYEGT